MRKQSKTQDSKPEDQPVDPQEAAQDDQGADDTAPEPASEPQAPVDLVEVSNAQGFHGAIPSHADDTDDALKAKTVGADDQDTDQADYFGRLPAKADDVKAIPLGHLPDQPDNLRQTEDQDTGYVGTLPDADDRPDLTLKAQAKAAREQYGDGKNA